MADFMNCDSNFAQECERSGESGAPLSADQKLLLLQLCDPRAWDRPALETLITDHDPRVRNWARFTLSLADALAGLSPIQGRSQAISRPAR